MSKYFPVTKQLQRRQKIELDFSNYTKKTDLKNATGVDASNFAKKLTYLIEKCTNQIKHLKNKVDKLNVDKLVPAPVDLSKLGDAVKKLCY